MKKLSRTQLSKKYNLTEGMWRNRHDDLLNHLGDFFFIEEIKEGRYYYYMVPDEIPNMIPKLSRKTNKQEKINDYANYVKDNLSEEFEPNSYVRMAREAIMEFGSDKYKHYGAEAVARRYVKPAMDEYGEHSAHKVWVDPTTYIVLTKEQEDYRHECFVKNHLTDQRLQEIGSESLEGIEPSQEDKDYYNKAMDKFIEKYGFRPILVYNWRAKRSDDFKVE